MNFAIENQDPAQAKALSEYLKQVKVETIRRFHDVIFNPEWGTMDLRYWLPLGKKDFLDFKF